MKDWLSIGEFSKRAGLSARAVRLYEEMGLITPTSRGENGYRYFNVEQIRGARRVCELTSLGFTLAEVRSLLAADHEMDSKKLIAMLKRRLVLASQEHQRIGEQKGRIQTILSSLDNHEAALNERERGYVMEMFKRATILVTGIKGLEATAANIGAHLSAAGQSAPIVKWNEATDFVSLNRPAIVIVPESDLAQSNVKQLKPDVILINNVSDASKEKLSFYFELYAHANSKFVTVLNADDRASIEIARDSRVQQGKIFYYSKNAGLRTQIQKIGGAVSDGDEITLYGLNDHEDGDLKIKLQKIRPLREEIAIIAALTAVIDLGLKPESIALTV